MNPLADVILRSGILTPGDHAEFARWKAPAIVDAGDDGPTIDSAAQVIEGIERALQSRELVLVRATDLDIVTQFLRSQKHGKLHVTVTDQEVTQQAAFDIVFGRSSIGEYILPWKSELVEDVLVDGSAYLVEQDENGNERNIHFSNVRVLYFGEQKTCIICTP